MINPSKEILELAKAIVLKELGNQSYKGSGQIDSIVAKVISDVYLSEGEYTEECLIKTTKEILKKMGI